MVADLSAVNGINGAADIRGAGHSVGLVRRFQHSLNFGGRFYAPHCQMSEAERLSVTVDGALVVEIDVKASQLTVLLGITGTIEAPPDAYAVPGIARDVVKAWVIQTLGAGQPATRWSQRGKGAGSGVTPGQVREALEPRYPFLRDLVSLVPQEALATLPRDRHPWGAGQWIVMREAQIIARALLALANAGIVALPVHDSLVVPEHAEARAREALRTAFVSEVGIEPRLEVARPAPLWPGVDDPAFWEP